MKPTLLAGDTVENSRHVVENPLELLLEAPPRRLCTNTSEQMSSTIAHERYHTAALPTCCSRKSKPSSNASNTAEQDLRIEESSSRRTSACHREGVVQRHKGSAAVALVEGMGSLPARERQPPGHRRRSHSSKDTGFLVGSSAVAQQTRNADS